MSRIGLNQYLKAWNAVFRVGFVWKRFQEMKSMTPGSMPDGAFPEFGRHSNRQVIAMNLCGSRPGVPKPGVMLPPPGFVLALQN